MKVFVIGGTGFLGPEVVRRLGELGHEVTVGHTGQHEADLPPEVHHVHHPLLTRVGRSDLTPLVVDLRRVRPDVVVDMFPMNEADARAVVNVFAAVARRVVAISSQDVYRAYGVLHGTEAGPLEPVPLTEEAPLRRKLYPYRDDGARTADDPLRWYDDYEKILVERTFQGEPALPATILRLPAVYGPNDGHRIFEYLKRMDDGRPAILLDAGAAAWRWTWGFVDNVALAISLAICDERASGRVFNVAEPDFLSQAEWVREIGRVAGWSGEVKIVPADKLPAHLRSTLNLKQDVVADTQRIRRELGFAEAVPRAEALRQTIDWERANPPAEIDPAKFDYAAEDAVLAG